MRPENILDKLAEVILSVGIVEFYAFLLIMIIGCAYATASVIQIFR
jgi:hypothetical protein